VRVPLEGNATPFPPVPIPVSEGANLVSSGIRDDINISHYLAVRGETNQSTGLNTTSVSLFANMQHIEDKPRSYSSFGLDREH
jgi:hypothetical protein